MLIRGFWLIWQHPVLICKCQNQKLCRLVLIILYVWVQPLHTYLNSFTGCPSKLEVPAKRMLRYKPSFSYSSFLIKNVRTRRRPRELYKKHFGAKSKNNSEKILLKKYWQSKHIESANENMYTFSRFHANLVLGFSAPLIGRFPHSKNVTTMKSVLSL